MQLAPAAAKARCTAEQLELRTLLLGAAGVERAQLARARRHRGLEEPAKIVQVLRTATVRRSIWKHLERFERWCFACGFTCAPFTRSQRRKLTPRCQRCVAAHRSVRARASAESEATVRRRCRAERRSTAVFARIAWRTSRFSRRLSGACNRAIAQFGGVAFGAPLPSLPAPRSSMRGGRSGVAPRASQLLGPRRALLALSWHASARSAAERQARGLHAYRVEQWLVASLPRVSARGATPRCSVSWGASRLDEVRIDFGATRRLRLAYVGVRGLGLAPHAPQRCGWRLEGSVNGAFWRTLWGGSVEGCAAWRCVDLARQGATWERSECAALQTLWEHESVGAAEDASVQRLLGRDCLAASRSPRAPPPLRYYRLVRAAAAGATAAPRAEHSAVAVLVGLDLAGEVVAGGGAGLMAL